MEMSDHPRDSSERPAERSTGELAELVVADRRRIAQALHDDVVQSMSAALMALGLARIGQPDDPTLHDAEQALSTSAKALTKLIEDLLRHPEPS
ncbi:MAG: hypothetical protein CL424_08775 [Acidimicrobiaceae bacterium]|nr:hypothetical protein [Acidimicrobiaceae bacterium]